MRPVAWDQNALSAEIDPVVWKVRKINAPILGLLVHMGFETEPIHTARLASEESFVISAVMFISDPIVNQEERRKKS